MFFLFMNVADKRSSLKDKEKDVALGFGDRAVILQHLKIMGARLCGYHVSQPFHQEKTWLKCTRKGTIFKQSNSV